MNWDTLAVALIGVVAAIVLVRHILGKFSALRASGGCGCCGASCKPDASCDDK